MRDAIAAGAAVGAALSLCAFLWYASDALAYLLLGSLFGIFLSETAKALRRWVPLPQRWAVTVTVILLTAALAAAAFGMGLRLVDQFGQLAERIPQGLQAARGWLDRNEQLRALLARARGGDGAGRFFASAARGAGGFFAGAVETGVAALVVFFTGLFLAYSPDYYGSAARRLLPAASRPKARRIQSELWRSLWLWTLGRLFVMAAIAAAHVVAYKLLGVPLAFALGALAGLLSFVPYLGPIAATIPAALVALTKSPSLVLWVVAVHAVVQTAESHVLTPLAQSWFVDVPALASLAAAVLLGATMHVTGLLIATPAAAIALVLARELQAGSEGPAEG